MELVGLLIMLFLGLLALVVIGKIISWATSNNTPAVLLLLVVPILAYIAYKI
tara:strand:- start:294 stop:449 length:156 start_codon:yes stop_codon:yes gene_type:complete